MLHLEWARCKCVLKVAVLVVDVWKWSLMEVVDGGSGLLQGEDSGEVSRCKKGEKVFSAELRDNYPAGCAIHCGRLWCGCGWLGLLCDVGEGQPAGSGRNAIQGHYTEKNTKKSVLDRDGEPQDARETRSTACLQLHFSSRLW